MSRRKEKAVKGYSGISRILKLTPSGRWELDKYRAIKRVAEDGKSKKISACFEDFEDALIFRNSDEESSSKKNKAEVSLDVHKNTLTEKDGLTLKGLIKIFRRDHYVTIEKSTSQGYDKMMPHLSILSDTSVRDINAAKIKWLAFQWKEAPRRVNRKSYEKEWQLLRRLLSFYKEEIDEGGDYNIPSFKKARKLTTFDPTPFVPKVLMDEELVQFFEALGQDKSTQYQDLALCQYYLGSRIGEICGLHADQIDFYRNEVTISRTIHWDLRTWAPSVKNYPKNGQNRSVDIPQPLEPVLRRLVTNSHKSGLLFYRKDGSPLIRKTISSYFNKVLSDLGFSRYVSGTHFLRRQAATKIHDVTGSLNTTKVALGHSSVRVTEQYIASTKKQKESVANALGQLVGSVGQNLSHKVEKTVKDGGESLVPVPQCPTRVKLAIVK